MYDIWQSICSRRGSVWLRSRLRLATRPSGLWPTAGFDEFLPIASLHSTRIKAYPWRVVPRARRRWAMCPWPSTA